MTSQDLKNSILQLAIQGKLVTQNSNDESATELLTHLKAKKTQMTKDGKIKKGKPLVPISADEIPFDIPDNWSWVRLGEIGSLFSGYAFKSVDYTNRGIQVVRISDLSEDGISLKKAVYYPNKPDLDSYRIKKNSFLICLTGSIGKMAWVRDDTQRYLNQRVGMYIADSENLLDYLWIFLHAPFVINKWVAAKTSTNGNIKNSDVTDLICPIPPLAEQKRIVKKIEELMPLVEEYGKAQEQLTALNAEFPYKLRKSILQQAIQGKLTERDPADEPASELLKRIRTEKEQLIKEGKIKKEKSIPPITDEQMPFEIPAGWVWASIGETCTNIQYGTSEKSSSAGKIAVLRMGNLQNGRIDYSSLVYSSNDYDIERCHLDYNDLLFNRTNSKELVGKTSIYKAEIPAIYAGYLIRVTPVFLNADFLNYVMQSQLFKDYCLAVKSDAIGQSNINAEKLKHFVFPLPPLAEQQRIVDRVNELLALCDELK